MNRINCKACETTSFNSPFNFASFTAVERDNGFRDNCRYNGLRKLRTCWPNGMLLLRSLNGAIIGVPYFMDPSLVMSSREPQGSTSEWTKGKRSKGSTIVVVPPFTAVVKTSNFSNKSFLKLKFWNIKFTHHFLKKYLGLRNKCY